MVRSGEAIENPVSGERIVFRRTAGETRGELLVFDYRLRPGGSVPFAHVHPRQQERLEIVSGRARIRVGRKKLTVSAGESVVVPAGTAHRLWNDGTDKLEALVEFRPALRIEDGFAQLFALAREGKIGRFGLPRNAFRLAVLAHEFQDEVELAALPRLLQRTAAAMLTPVGRLLGYEAAQPNLEP